MATAQEAIARFNRTRERMDALLDLKVPREIRAFADEVRAREQERQDREEARRDQARRHSESRRKWAAYYDSIFGLFGERAPEPASNTFPGNYRRALFRSLQDKLVPGHDLGGINPAELRV
jgi:hypothetical protein